jgi:hypothetical protein
MSTTTTLILVQQNITRYVLSTILILGNLGNLTAILVFSQKKPRKNSFSIYLVTMSVFGCIASNWAIAPLVYVLDHYDMVDSSLILCRIRGYIVHVSGMCFRYTLVLMCADRYASSSSRVSIRALCRPQIAYRSIGILLIFWMTASIHLLILESIESNRCGVYGIYGQIFSFYSLIFTGIIPVSVMASFFILLLNTLRQSRFRVQPFENTRRLNQRDMNLMKLVLIEMIVYIVCTINYPLVSIYMQITNNMGLDKSADRKQIESFVNFIAMSVLLYLNYNTTFYVHICTSKSYRTEVKSVVLKSIGKLRENEQTQDHALGTVNQPRVRQKQAQMIFAVENI